MAHGDGLGEMSWELFTTDTIERTFSSKLACPDHGVSIEELEPQDVLF